MSVTKLLIEMETPRKAHWFAPGASEEQISACEAAIGQALPSSYKEFLRITNGAILYETEELFATEFFWEYGESIAEAMTRLRQEETPFPDGCVPFAECIVGSYWCFDMRDYQVEDPPVVRWMTGRGLDGVGFASFEDWLRDLYTRYHSRYA